MTRTNQAKDEAFQTSEHPSMVVTSHRNPISQQTNYREEEEKEKNVEKELLKKVKSGARAEYTQRGKNMPPNFSFLPLLRREKLRRRGGAEMLFCLKLP